MLEEKRQKEQVRDKMEAAEREELERMEREEQERKEHEEYLLMKEAFSVDQEGYDETEAEKEVFIIFTIAVVGNIALQIITRIFLTVSVAVDVARLYRLH